MRSVKQFLTYAALLLVFVIGTAIVLKQYKMYKRAYQELTQIIAHTSIETETFHMKEGTE